MGNVIAPPVDYRTERVMEKFQIPMEKIEELWHVFRKYALSDEKSMTKDEFFGLIRYKETVLTDQVFKLIGSENDMYLSFGEFVEIVTTFSCFEKRELMQYFFYILDPMRTGLIEKTELKHFVNGMWEHRTFKNITDGLNYLDSIDDGDCVFNIHQVKRMEARFPMVLYPLYRLQASMIHNTLGERWWEAHKAVLADARREAIAKEAERYRLKEKAYNKEKEVVGEDMVRQRVGNLKYYLMPWMRAPEKKRLLRIVAIEDDLDRTLSAKFNSYGTIHQTD